MSGPGMRDKAVWQISHSLHVLRHSSTHPCDFDLESFLASKTKCQGEKRPAKIWINTFWTTNPSFRKDHAPSIHSIQLWEDRTH